MAPTTLNHASLGTIKCLRDAHTSLIKILGLPYGTIPQRFGRAEQLVTLSNSSRFENNVFDATKPAASSIQPWCSVTMDAANIPLPTDNLPDDEEQSEDCLNISIRLPPTCIDSEGELRTDAKLPVLVFIHGGAFFIGSGTRPYYDSTSLILCGIQRGTPFIMVSVNYRLGILGFMHSPSASDLIPENNGLYDQNLALSFVKDHISDFGGDSENITVLGQSAGGESISVKTIRSPLFKRAIAFSGTPVTMPSMTPSEHHANFLSQASSLGIATRYANGEERKAEDIAHDFIAADIQKVRELAWVGLPCAESEFFPVSKPSMELMRAGKMVPSDWRSRFTPAEAQIVGTTTYDGGISYNMMSNDSSRSGHAKAFLHIACDVLGDADGAALCEIYGMKKGMIDSDALQAVCLFESDIGFFAAALATCEADLIPKTYFHVFDLPNPFEGPIREQGEFATHTFDIVTLLGGVSEDRLPESYGPVVSKWRDTILDFVVSGKAPCEEYIAEGRKGRKGLMVSKDGVRDVGEEEWLDNDGGRRRRLFELAQKVKGDGGCDVLWMDVGRRFLMKGE
ncbi:alpha/beta-hydrolase [Didymella exigua CBS 183.55]|uniref:Carboxylic ester hydrolase n=1 Tax=Didymella exigua CBS 183.55 TaxID=1150837 RepID=A0A6A5RKN7_9PLEO|nr:alpha/beta-hydrolase [Didymella exigua CBS 183.55]KAF1928965.1 alpha/beta-hydrolase [Didymella exigua CBS 183.55]